MSQRTYLVTGTSVGIGFQTAKYLLTQNVRVIGVSRRETPLSHPAFTHIQGDLTKEDVQAKIVKEVGSKLDGAVFNAGVLLPVTKIADLDVAGWKQLFDINFFSIVSLTSQLIPALRAGHGKAVFVSSGAGTGAYQSWGAYGSSKAALNHFTGTLAVEEPDIIPLAISPGSVDTDMQLDIREHAGEHMKPGEHAKFVDLHKKKQLVDPRDSGVLLGNLAMNASNDFRGRTFRYNDVLLVSYNN